MYKMSFSYIGGYGVFYLSFSSLESAEEYAEKIKNEVKRVTIWKES